MGSVATILLIGTFYGLFEIKYLTITGIVLFETGSALCGGAPNMNAIIVGRVIAGIGGAAMYLGYAFSVDILRQALTAFSALNYMAIFTSITQRPIYNAAIGLCWGTGCILGPVIGGGFAGSSATWRWYVTPA
jgi:MFS family permease